MSATNTTNTNKHDSRSLWWKPQQGKEHPKEQKSISYKDQQVLQCRIEKINEELMTKQYYYKTGGNNNNDETPPIERLPKELIVEIFSYLGLFPDTHVAKLLSLPSFEPKICASVSRFFAECARDEPRLWKAACHAKYGTRLAQDTIDLYEGNWRDMALSDNGKGALRTIKGLGPQCYKKQNGAYRFTIMGAQWHRSERYVRIYIDARGNWPDFYHPKHFCRLVYKKIHHGKFTEKWSFRMVQCELTTNTRDHYKGYLTFSIDWPVNSWDNVLLSFGNITLNAGLLSHLENTTCYTSEENVLFLDESEEEELDRWRIALPEDFKDGIPTWYQLSMDLMVRMAWRQLNQ